ncbi:MAG: copper resistance protein NlpE N-terminal domain-containing protein, partial [Spirochaetales bacterium]|nr:copper resistance protein NlpE N-terminal domain-containing protein [Spirochaetales bacterium]
MKKLLFLGIAASAVIFWSCLPARGGAGTGASAEMSLTDNRWILAGINGKDIPQTSGTFRAEPFIMFQSADNMFFGSGGLNTLRGTFRQEADGRVRISGIAKTLMAGPNMEFENEFTLTLEEITNYSIQADELVLSRGGGPPLLRFTALTPQALAGLYTGVLPCADCEGIEMAVTLMADGAYTIIWNYLKGSDPWQVEESGVFSIDLEANRVTLEDTEGPLVYALSKNKLIQLDMDAEFILGELAENYILTKNNVPEKENAIRPERNPAGFPNKPEPVPKLNHFLKPVGRNGIGGARSGRVSGGTPGKPGFCEAKMRTNDYGFHFG